MAAKKKAAKAGAAAVAAKNSPYVQRIIEDEELRQTIWGAYEAAAKAYKRLGSGKASPAKQIFDDKRLQRELQTAAVSLRDASVSLRAAPKARKRGGLGRKLLLVVITGGVALALSEDLRNKALDLLFGAEEEFEYSAPAPAESPATANAGS